jgi:hypothetical protein
LIRAHCTHLYEHELAIKVYVVDPGFARPVVVPGAGWYEAEHEGMRRWRWMGNRAEMLLLTREQAVVALSWRATAYGSSRILHVRQGDRLLNTLDVPAAPYSRMITLRLILPQVGPSCDWRVRQSVYPMVAV